MIPTTIGTRQDTRAVVEGTKKGKQEAYKNDTCDKVAGLDAHVAHDKEGYPFIKARNHHGR